MKLTVFWCIATLYASPIDNVKPENIVLENAKFNGSLVGKSTLMKFCCELWQRPIGNSVLFQVNFKTVDVITFKNNKCYAKDKECKIEMCSCSNDENKFQMEYWFKRPQAAKSQRFGVEILLKNNESNIVTLTLWRYYDGKEFGNLHIAEEISQHNLLYNKDKINNGLVIDAVHIFIIVTVILILIVTLCMRCICRSHLHELLRKGRYVQLLTNDSHEKTNSTSEATYNVASQTATNAAPVVHLSSINAEMMGDLASAFSIFTRDNSEERLNINFISPNECSVDVKMKKNSSAMSNVASKTAANDAAVVHLSSIEAVMMGDVASAIPIFTWNTSEEILNLYWISPNECSVDIKMKEYSSGLSNVASKTATNAAPVVHLSSIDVEMMGDVASENPIFTWDTLKERININLLSPNECTVDVKMKEYSSALSNVAFKSATNAAPVVHLSSIDAEMMGDVASENPIFTWDTSEERLNLNWIPPNVFSVDVKMKEYSSANEAQFQRNRFAEVFGVVNTSIQTMAFNQMIEHLCREEIYIDTVDCPLNFVSFVRFGKTSFSKSIMIIMKCSDQYQCTISTLYISPARCNEEVLRNELITSRKPMYNERRHRDISVVDDQFRFPISKQEMRNNVSESVSEQPFVPLWQRLKEAFYSEGKTPDRDTLQGEFNHFWSSRTNQSCIKNNIDFFSIADQIENLLYNKFRLDPVFYMHKSFKRDLFYDHLRKLEERISAGRIPPEYFNRIVNCLVLGKEKSENCRNETVHIINQTFRKIDLMLLDLDSQDIRLDISHVTEKIKIIVNDIDNHNDHTAKAKKKSEVEDNVRKLDLALHELYKNGLFVPVGNIHNVLNSWWYCDPTMAPESPGHSKCLNRVKDALFCDSSMTQRKTYLKITDTISRIEDLWIGILKDDFVFSLQNGLEVKAYNSMERRCQSRTWTLEKYVLECIWCQAKGMLATCLNDKDLDNAFLNIVARVALDKEQQVISLCNDPDSFVEGSTLKDVMIQWI